MASLVSFLVLLLATLILMPQGLATYYKPIKKSPVYKPPVYKPKPPVYKPPYMKPPYGKYPPVEDNTHA